MLYVAAAEGCDRAARSQRSCWRRRPCGSIAGCASGYRGRARHDNGAVLMLCVAAAEGCDRAARSRGSCNRQRPCGSITGCASGYRGSARHD